MTLEKNYIVAFFNESSSKNEKQLDLNGQGKIVAILDVNGEDVQETVYAYLAGEVSAEYDKNIFGTPAEYATGGWDFDNSDIEIDFSKSTISDDDAERLGDYYPIKEIVSGLDDIEWHVD